MIFDRLFTMISATLFGIAFVIFGEGIAQPTETAPPRPAPAAPATQAAATAPTEAEPALSEDDAYERAIELIAATRETEAWLDEKKSVHIRATKTWQATPDGTEALANEPPRENLTHPLLPMELFVEILPGLKEDIEVAWDERRVSRIHEIPGVLRRRWAYDGRQAATQIRALDTNDERNVLDNELKIISPFVMEPFSFGRADVREAWWAPVIPPHLAKFAQDTIAQYKLLRTENLHGAEHHVLGTVETEWWIDAETKLISMYRNLQTLQSGPENRSAIQQATWAFLRSQGYPVTSEEEDTALGARLSRESPEIFKALQRSITEALIRKGLIRQFVVDEFLLLDYKEVAPGCFWPMKQISRHNSVLGGREGMPLVQSETVTTLAEVGKPVPDDLFVIQLTEGGRVEDFREDIKLTYLHKPNRTEEEWDLIRNSRKAELEKKQAQQEKLQNLLGKPAPKLAAAYWVNSDPVTLQDLSGRFVLLYFWANWYPASTKDFPQLEQMHLIHGHMVKLISVHTPVSLHRSFFDSAVPTLVDFSEVPPRQGMLGETAFLYGVTKLPYSILIGPEGSVLAHGPFQEIYKQLMRMMLPKPGQRRGPAPAVPGTGLPTPPPAGRPGGSAAPGIPQSSPPQPGDTP